MQQEAFAFTRLLLNWRKNNKVVQYGEFTHFLPQDGVYTYFRHNEDGAVMVMLNNTTEEKEVDLSRFEQILDGYSKGQSVLSRKTFESLDKIIVPAKAPLIVELIE